LDLLVAWFAGFPDDRAGALDPGFGGGAAACAAAWASMARR
jgi:hypothetical protein